MTAAPDKIINRIQLLLKLANSNPSETEAALALGKAQALMAEFNLDAATVADSTPADEKRSKTKIDRGAKFKWQRDLWKALAKANFCWYWTVDQPKVLTIAPASDSEDMGYPSKRGQSKSKRHMLLGRRNNVSAVVLMGEYLEDAMSRLCPYPRLSWAGNSWKAGCAERLVSRIRQKAEELKKASGESTGDATGTALMTLTDVYAAEYRLNYDALHGAGAHDRKLIQDETWEREAKEAEERREREWLDYLQNEPPLQKKLREKEEARERRRQEKNWERRRYSGWGRSRKSDAESVHEEAYSAGSKAGSSIGLDSQVSRGAEPRRLG